MQIVSQRKSKIVHTEWIKIRNYVVGICKITNVECFAWDTEQIIDRRIKKNIHIWNNSNGIISAKQWTNKLMNERTNEYKYTYHKNTTTTNCK